MKKLYTGLLISLLAACSNNNGTVTATDVDRTKNNDTAPVVATPDTVSFPTNSTDTTKNNHQ
jgi:hypothetical protein